MKAAVEQSRIMRVHSHASCGGEANRARTKDSACSTAYSVRGSGALRSEMDCRPADSRLRRADGTPRVPVALACKGSATTFLGR